MNNGGVLKSFVCVELEESLVDARLIECDRTGKILQRGKRLAWLVFKLTSTEAREEQEGVT